MIDSDMTCPYRGLTPYTEADYTYFFGRTNEIATIASNLAVARLTLFYGPSGVGKTSVLRAGVFYQLQQRAQANCAISGSPEVIPVYFNTWQHVPLVSLTQAIREAIRPYIALNEQQDPPEIPHSFTAFLRSVTHQTSSDLLLILDQFEEYFLYHANESGPGTFADELVQAINSPDLPVNFLFSLREDALARLDRFKGQITFLFDNRLSIDYLGRVAGREAITKPLEQYNQANQAAYTIEPTLVEAVLDQVGRGKVALARQGTGMAIAESDAERIETPYLQLVLVRLWAEEQKLHSAVLRLQTLVTLGGAEKIVASYLDDTMTSLSMNHQAIAARFFDRLVTPSGTKIALSLDELLQYAKSDPLEVQVVLQELQIKRLLRGVQSPAGVIKYELFHDVLAQAILDWQSHVPWRTAEYYFSSGLLEWREAKQSKQMDLLLDRERYQCIWASKEIFTSLTAEANEFLTRTALYHGDVSFGYWLNQIGENDAKRLELVVKDYVFHNSENIRKATQSAILQAKQQNQLNLKIQQKLAEIFRTLFLSADDPSFARTSIERADQTVLLSAQTRSVTAKGLIRDCTAPLLWALRKFIDISTLRKVIPIALGVWVRNHRASPIFVATSSSLLVALLILIIWGANQRLRGTWQREPLLFAGPISAAAWVKEDPNLIYVVTPTGSDVGSRTTLWLYNQGKDSWEHLSSSLTVSPITFLSAIKFESKVRLYIGIWGKGIIRSDDNGKTWQTINVGLHSYVISKLIHDENDKNILYAGSADEHGIFESRDGGDTWQDISGDELFGASVSAMAYTGYEGGALIVCTSDARIMARKTGGKTWENLWDTSTTGVVNSISTEPLEKKVVYAGTVRGDVLISLDGGSSWYVTQKPSGVFSINSVVAVPGHPENALIDTYGVGGYIVWQTDDAGESWKPIGDDQFTREPITLQIHQQQADTLYAFGAPGFFETQNNGTSWIYNNLRAPIASVSHIAISRVNGGPTYLAVGGAVFINPEATSGSWQRGNGLTAFTVRALTTDIDDKTRAYVSVYLPNQWSVLFTEDSGKTWQPTMPPDTIPEKFLNDTTALEVSRGEGQEILYVGTNGCGIIHSLNKGKTWETFGRRDCNLGRNAPTSVIDLAVAPQSPDTLYVAADSTRIYVTKDRGKRWQVTNMPFTNPIWSIAVDPMIPNRVYLTAGTDGFWRSDDGAKNWKSYSTDFKEKLVEKLIAIPNTPETLYVSTSNAEIWKTTDGGNHWSSAKENLTINSIADLAYDYQKHEIVLSSWQDGLYRFKPGSLFKFWNRNEVTP